MNVTKSTEVRTVNAVNVTPDRHFFFGGAGLVRQYLNDGQPQVLNARRNVGNVSGQMTGVVKIVEIKGAFGWYSIRSIGVKGNRFTVYVKGDSLCVVDGVEYKVADLYHNA